MSNDGPHKIQKFTFQNKPLLFILSGPSGVGKDAVLNKLKKSSYPLKYIITMTTRPRRENETHGVDYTFVTKQDFQALIDSDGLLEWANVYGNMYGVPRIDVETALAEGHDVMVKVDIQGVDNIKRIRPDAISIFLMTPSIDDLFERLERRKTESDASLKLRKDTASEEMARVRDFDYAVVNRPGEIDNAVSDIESIITAEKCRPGNRILRERLWTRDNIHLKY
jgi:guanylate kinase